ncbi:MAG: response regulator [Campylobacterales bacterium]|nr:response regulator [Campylobacterales bacterium]
MSLKDITVLYVEDEEDVREEIVDILSRKIQKLYVATNGEEALELFKKSCIDLIITDIKMPIMDGLEMIGKIRELDNAIPIIITSAFNDVTFLKKAIDLKVDNYLIKPVDLVQFFSIIERSSVVIFQKRELIKKQKQLDLSTQISGLAYWEFDMQTNTFKANDIYYNFLATNKEKEGSYEKSIDQFLNSFVLKDSHKTIIDALSKAKYNSSTYKDSLELKMKKRDGEVIDVEVNYYMEYDSNNEPLKAFGTQHDLTKHKNIQKELEQLLIQQSKMAAMGEMIGNIAHQWKQPLNALSAVMIHLSLLYETKSLNDQNMKDIDAKVDKLIKKMSSTIDDFRNFFKVDKELKSFVVLDSIENILEIVSSSLDNHNIKIEIDKSKDKITLDGYKNEFEQVMLNIISNAKDALVQNNTKDAKISIWIEEADEVVNVSVLDNGGGINDEIIDKVFEPYFTTKSDDKGTGIGLYMSKIIVETKMNGKIEVKNRDGGALFVMRFKKGE